MPLIFASIGKENTIKKVGGSSKIKRHLENLGFIPGSTATVISIIAGNVIVSVKESRIAISREMAQKIII